jgi:SAM-dependent methyltransferase
MSVLSRWKRVRTAARGGLSWLQGCLERLRQSRRDLPPVLSETDSCQTPVDQYWNQHTVNSRPFQTVKESLEYLEWRSAQYPMFIELTGLWGDRPGQTVLDYGCGPGNDLVGFLVHARAQRVVGVDVSEKALNLARHRLALHGIEHDRITLVRKTDADYSIPLADASVDYISCQGVLHHLSHPQDVLREMRRVLRPGGQVCIMVYNRDSLWFHLYTAYVKMIVEGSLAGLTPEEAFRRNTDGDACPVSRCYAHADFLSVCAQAGFRGQYLGGYLSRHELHCLREHGDAALADPRLPEPHREFLRSLLRDSNGLPTHSGYLAGIGGVYHLG